MITKLLLLIYCDVHFVQGCDRCKFMPRKIHLILKTHVNTEFYKPVGLTNFHEQVKN